MSYTFTSEDILREREGRALSWRQVAVNLDLPNPGAARKAYDDLTGTSHKDSRPSVKRDTASGEPGTVKVRPSRKSFVPKWGDDMDEGEQEAMIEKLTAARIKVVRKCKGATLEEDLRTSSVSHLSYETEGGSAGLTAHVYDHETGGCRSIRVTDIVSVR